MSDEVKPLDAEELVWLNALALQAEICTEQQAARLDELIGVSEAQCVPVRLLATIAERDERIASYEKIAVLSGDLSVQLLARANSAEATCARLREALTRCADELEESIENEGKLASFKHAAECARAALTQADGERG